MSPIDIPSRTRPERVKPRGGPPPSSSNPSHPSGAVPQASTTADTDSEDDTVIFHDARFPPEEEDRLLNESHSLKNLANAQFGASDFSQAVSTYDRAVASCPNYLDYEIAVLQSNIAACHLKLQEWKEAIESADRALGCLDKEDPPPKAKKEKKKSDTGKASKGQNQEQTTHDGSSDKTESDSEPTDGDNGVVELPDSDTEESTTAALNKLNLSDERRANINRIRTKSLLRRARARHSLAHTLSQQGKTMFSPTPKDSESDSSKPARTPTRETLSPWTLLSAAQSDYQLLAAPDKPYSGLLPPSDRRTVTQALSTLSQEIDQAKQKEVGEMMGKLKELGNGILKPFGLSTDMFKMTQDPATGGYSLSMDSGSRK